MKKILIAVDDTKGSQAIMSVFKNQVRAPEEVILVHVQRILGRSLMGDMLGDPEIEILKEAIMGTEFQEKLDKKAEKIISYYKKELDNSGLMTIKPVIRAGIPSDEILKVANEEQVDMMILGCNGKSMMTKMLCGCTTKDVERKVGVPVLVAKPDGANCGKKGKVCQPVSPQTSKAFA